MFVNGEPQRVVVPETDEPLPVDALEQQASALVDFFNGDWTSNTLTHYANYAFTSLEVVWHNAMPLLIFIIFQALGQRVPSESRLET